MAQIKDLTKEQLCELRKQITLNSLYIRDYENSFDIDPKECCAFFDGYVENLYALAETYELATDDFFEIVKQHDNINNLYDYWCEVVAN